MDYLHPVMAAALGPFIPPKSAPRVEDGSPLNDDDVYLVDIPRREIVRRIGRRSDYGLRNHPTVPVGCAALTGMQCRSLLG